MSGFRQGDQALFIGPTGAVTLSSNAGTITTNIATVTSESLTTAHTASATLVITRVGTKAADLCLIQPIGGTNTGGVPVFKPVCTADTITITLTNNAIATNAFNGTFVFAMVIIPTAAS